MTLYSDEVESQLVMEFLVDVVVLFDLEGAFDLLRGGLLDLVVQLRNGVVYSLYMYNL